jgi:DNA polymerase
MPELHREVAAYAIDDAKKCAEIYRRMLDDGFPANQLELIDMVIRMAAQPKFEIDQITLAEHRGQIQAEKQALLDAAQLEDRSSLMRDQALAAMLLFRLGYAPMKPSPSNPEKQIYAFAKTDKAFTDLLEHDDPWVQAVVAARLGHKSTLEETRTERMMAIARVAPSFPIPLRYSGAHTHRLSGDWSVNMQNLPRGGKLRQALRAPEGQLVVSVDASQIEARFNATLSEETNLVNAFRLGKDVYCQFAEQIYQHPVNADDHPKQRSVGKIAVLSLGYGASAPVFQSMCRNQDGIILTDMEAFAIVGLYRSRYAKIKANWQHAEHSIIPSLASMSRSLRELTNSECDWWGPLRVEAETILLPSGNKLRYRDLHQETFADENGVRRTHWVYYRGKRLQRLYGPKVVENVVQAMAFVHIMDVARKVKAMTRGMLLPAHQIHDELLYVVPEHQAEKVRDLVVREMAKSPPWMPDAPLAAKGKIGRTYADTK